MSKKNVVVSNVGNVGENGAVNRRVFTAEQFLEKVAMAHNSNMCSDRNNFQCVEIADMVISNKSLENAEFYFSKLSGIKFENCDLSSIEFNNTEFNDVVFSHCKIEHTHFDYTQMNNVSFQQCFLNGSDFDFTAGKAEFDNCSMEYTEFPMSSLELRFNNCNLSRAELNGCSEMKMEAVKSDFTQAELNDCTLNGSAIDCVFSNAEFNGSNGVNFRFSNCKLRRIETDGSVGIVDGDSDDEDTDLDVALEDIFK